MILENKKKIARELDKQMHTFIYLFGDTHKFSSNTQDIFELLNEWTMGNIWDNFIIVFNKATFTTEQVNHRYTTMEEMFHFGPEELVWKRYFEQLNHIKETLTERALQKRWKRIVNVGGRQKSRLMKREDFDNIKISAVNFVQARQCALIDGIIDSHAFDCWKSPIMNHDFDYQISSDPDKMDYPQFHEDKYIFIDEMKKLYQMIIENANRPVRTQKEYFKSEFLKDIKDYHDRSAVMHIDVTNALNNTDIDVSHCDEKFEEVKSNLKETLKCPEWSLWGKWTECPFCGFAKTNRTRNCLKDNQRVNEMECFQESPDSELYQENNCKFKTCEFTPWTDISTCSASCGEGVKDQKRKCQGSPDDCIGDVHRKVSCELQPCPTWETWSNWSQCSKSCGRSSQSRKRICSMNGVESAVSYCYESWHDEQSSEVRPCEFKPCKFTDWKDVSNCSVPCGQGFKEQIRNCTGSSYDCIGETNRKISCEIQSCPTWDTWSDWSTCSKFCGSSSQTRARVCLKNGLKSSLSECYEIWPDEKSSETRPCEFKPCKFTQWQDVSNCSASCGQGVKHQFRKCTGLPEDCIGETEREITCQIQSCPTWGKWSNWSNCSKSCGKASKTRARLCLKDDLELNVTDCLELSEVNASERRACDFVSCGFTEWKNETDCATSCGSSFRQEVRECLAEPTDCKGIISRVVPCELSPCPIWEIWSEWSSCSQTCGDGQKTRERSCVKNTCTETQVDRNDCKVQECEFLS